MNAFFRRATPLGVTLGLSVVCLIVVSLLPGLIATTNAAPATPQVALTTEQTVFFEKNIRPVLANNCYGCHSAESKAAGGLLVDSRETLLKGGHSGPAVVPGDPETSLLLKRIHLSDEKHRMPKGDDPLQKSDVDNLTTWIKEGAFWPSNTGLTLSAGTSLPPQVAAASVSLTPTSEQLAYFKKDVRPILVNHCYACHSAATNTRGGLRLDTSIGIQTGGNAGPAAIPGNPEKSPLLKRVSLADPQHRMPKDSAPLSHAEIATLTTWIKQGAVLPDETEKLPPLSATLTRTYSKLKAQHWAFQPLTDPQVPQVSNKAWSAGNIDKFVLVELAKNKLAPVKDADQDTLIRRVTYDLTGLPPTPEAVASFRRNHSRHAYEHLVDRLLASPRYGERWGRHWLDIARYAESTGPSRNVPYPHAWRYRDYVINSVNQDVPYNRFIQEQIAGDLLPAASPTDRDRLLIATGFLALGVKDVNQRFPSRFLMDNVDDQIDTVTRSVLSMTVSCARCHDHKFDPIPTKDYYALAGIFTSSDTATGLNSHMGGAGLSYYVPKDLLLLSSASKAVAPPAGEAQKLTVQIVAARKAIEALRDTPQASDPAGKKTIAALNRSALHLQETRLDLVDLATRGYGIHGVREGYVADTSVRIRGIEERHGPTVPRGFLTAFVVPGVPSVDPKQSGRLQLAEWLTNSTNPLTARVAVNRIWEHLFGQGIVSTVDNFGVTGDRPSDPELLDYLASDFIHNGWSSKKLIREIVLSHTYRLGSGFPQQYKDVDPNNRLLWRHSPRRLEAEEIRDSILFSSGSLNLTPPAGSPARQLKMIELQDGNALVKTLNVEADHSSYRSIYLPLLRGITPHTLAAFDPVTQSLVTGQRDVTIVPTQALFMLNSTFVRQQSLALAGRLLAEPDHNISSQIRSAYGLVLCRTPTKEELSRDIQFINKYETTYRTTKPEDVHLEIQVIKQAKMPEADDKLLGITDNNAEEVNLAAVDEPIHSKSPEEAALMSLVQALYASAEFQFVR
jgi:hypothetical protein